MRNGVKMIGPHGKQCVVSETAASSAALANLGFRRLSDVIPSVSSDGHLSTPSKQEPPQSKKNASKA
jgi:hypothetical protein